MSESRALRRLSSRWTALGGAARRRIVLGLLLAVGVAARDVVLLFVTGALFMLSEMAPRTVGRPAASS